eukprot:118368-Pelagomonas_calceolata.AAC.1
MSCAQASPKLTSHKACNVQPGVPQQQPQVCPDVGHTHLPCMHVFKHSTTALCAVEIVGGGKVVKILCNESAVLSGCSLDGWSSTHSISLFGTSTQFIAKTKHEARDNKTKTHCLRFVS